LAMERVPLRKQNLSTHNKHVPAPLCPPQCKPGLDWERTRAFLVRGRRLNVWTMAVGTAVRKCVAVCDILMRNGACRCGHDLH
jgi:hypothetical protein